MPTPADDITPETMRMSIGEALRVLDACVVEAGAWRLLNNRDGTSDGDVASLLNLWSSNTADALSSMYVSPAAMLRFAAAEPEARVSPHRVMLRNIFNRRCIALLDERQAMLDLRDRIASTAADLADRISKHEELLGEIRGARALTDDTWQELVAKPSMASPLTRLANFGLTQNAVWDLIKLTLGPVFGV